MGIAYRAQVHNYPGEDHYDQPKHTPWFEGQSHVCRLLVLAAVFAACTSITTGAEPSKLENIARGAKYTLSPGPNYSLCTDPGDASQLTDGRSTSEYFWADKGTVGWSGAKYATVTVDLGRVEPIGGVALTTAAGAAQVTWPAAIHVLVSDDGKTYRDAGDLVALDRKTGGPMPKAYAIRRLVSTELATRGRYVQFAIIPLPGGPYMFVDEVEVFRGSEDLAARAPGGDAVTAAQIFEKGRIRRSLQIRFGQDVDTLRRTIAGAKLLDDATRSSLLASVEKAAAGLDPGALKVDRSFRAVLPLCPSHGKLFEVQAAFWRALERPELSAWVPATWEPVDLSGVPPVGAAGGIEVHTMSGEYRAAAFNLANASDRPIKVRIRFEGLPGAPIPDYVTLHEVQWTDTAQSDPVAAALPEVEPEGGVWTVSVLPGIVRQVWLTFNVLNLPADEYSGKLVIESAGTGTREIPVSMRVWPFEFPDRTSLLLGGWSYTNGNMYGVTAENREAFVAASKKTFRQLALGHVGSNAFVQVCGRGSKSDQARHARLRPLAGALAGCRAVHGFSGGGRLFGRDSDHVWRCRDRLAPVRPAGGNLDFRLGRVSGHQGYRTGPTRPA